MGASSIDQSGRAFSEDELRAIIGEASTLSERLSGEVIPTGQDRSLAAKRLERWKHHAANGDEAAFRRRLTPTGLGNATDDELLPLLGEVRPASGFALSRWAALLQEMVTAISAAFSTGESFHPIKPLTTHPVPFARIYLPIVALAKKKVGTMASGKDERMHTGAWRNLESWLLERISAVCSLALQPRFLAFKAVRRCGSALSQFEKNPTAKNDCMAGSLFDAFVHAQGREGLRPFFAKFPTAARLSAQVVLFWIDFVAEFLGRLELDAEAISARFLARRPLGKIVRIKAGISDPHHGGRSVLGVHFESGLHLVYKPRPMQIDVAFSDLLSWLNTRGQTPALPVLAVLTREHYGWESFIEHSSCRSQREARQFFRRAGVLLYLAHALRGIDFHRENMVATAGGPVLVDLEALCHPPCPDSVLLEDGSGGSWQYDASIFRTGMLPLPGRRPDQGHFSKLSALDGSILQRSPDTDIRWKHVNSGEMEASMGSTRMVCGTHRARLHGRLLSLRGHGKELLEGFQRMARLVRPGKPLFTRWQALAAGMNALPTRLIIRPTSLYAMMIRRSLQPRFLVAGVDRSIEFQALPPITGNDESRQAELAALEVLDVPAFFRMPGTDDDPFGMEMDLASQVAAIRACTAKRRHTVRRDRRPHASSYVQ